MRLHNFFNTLSKFYGAKQQASIPKKSKYPLLSKIIYFIAITVYTCIVNFAFNWSLIRNNNSISEIGIFLLILFFLIVCLIFLIVKIEQE